MIQSKFYLLNFYTTSKSESPIFNERGGAIYLYVNKNEEKRGAYDYPIIALNYAMSDDLKDQLTERKYTYNVKNYLRFDKGNKYTSAEKIKQRINIGTIVAILSIGIAIFGMGYYIYHDKKKNQVKNTDSH